MVGPSAAGGPIRGWRQGAGLPLWQPRALPTPEPFVLQGQSRISCGPETPAEPPGGAGQACACRWAPSWYRKGWWGSLGQQGRAERESSGKRGGWEGSNTCR